MKEGMKLGVANGGNVVFHVKDGKTYVNDARATASFTSSTACCCRPPSSCPIETTSSLRVGGIEDLDAHANSGG